MKSITPISASAPASFRLAFQRRFGREPRVFSAPGRVNLIGEHTDYNDGFVLPIAIQQRTLVAAAARPDKVVRVYSNDLDDERSFALDEPPQRAERVWLDYIEGVARSLLARGFACGGADLMVTSEVPQGAGLSSSAALELATGLALASLAGSTPSPEELARIGQLAEHTYVGVQCGIMDQMVSAIAKENHALLIDCRTLETRHVRLPLGEHTLLLCDTGVRHSHTVSGYNQRRQECETAVQLIAKNRPIRALRDVTPAELSGLEASLAPELWRRVRHVVTENQRTLAAVEALESADLARLGRLMLASHDSLRDDYQVSCAELDHVVAVASQHQSVLGARMTGGGFGGAAIILAKGDQLVRVSERIASSFKERFGHTPELRVVGCGDGMREEPSA